jgi:hypothetical protein
MDYVTPYLKIHQNQKLISENPKFEKNQFNIGGMLWISKFYKERYIGRQPFTTKPSLHVRMVSARSINVFASVKHTQRQTIKQ